MWMPELEYACVLHREERHPTRLRVALPLDADEVCVLGLGSFVIGRECGGFVVIVGRLERDSQDGCDWIGPAIRFSNFGKALDGQLEAGVPELDVVDVGFQEALADGVPQPDGGL